MHATDWKCKLWYDVVVGNAFHHGPLLSAAWGSGTECGLTHPPQTQSEKRIHLAITALSRSCHRDPVNAFPPCEIHPWETDLLWSTMELIRQRGRAMDLWPPAPSYPQLPQSFHLHSSTCVGWQILISTSGIFLLFSWCSCSATGWTDSGHGTGYKLQPPCALGLVGNGPFLLSSNNWSHTI